MSAAVMAAVAAANAGMIAANSEATYPTWVASIILGCSTLTFFIGLVALFRFYQLEKKYQERKNKRYYEYDQYEQYKKESKERYEKARKKFRHELDYPKPQSLTNIFRQDTGEIDYIGNGDERAKEIERQIKEDILNGKG